MKVLEVRNVQEALPAGLDYLRREGVERDSRNGPVLVAPGPVTTVFREPRERVIFWPERDANPFFHLAESLWMLAGRDDVAYPAQFVKRMRDFSDDGKIFHGAYGFRWRNHFLLEVEDPPAGAAGYSSIDQIESIILMLTRNPDDRRCVLQMWDATVDLGRKGKDIPCNTQAYFSRGGDGELNMTVCCRSNDMIWGAYGANAVHFSYLQEYIAAGIGCEVGRYWQMSNNYHAYADLFEKLEPLADRAPDPFRTKEDFFYDVVADPMTPFPLVSTPLKQWRQDLAMFLDEGVVIGLRDPFFRRVATPMLLAHRAYQENTGEERYEKALEILGQCQALDWKAAGKQWVTRRYEKWKERD